MTCHIVRGIAVSVALAVAISGGTARADDVGPQSERPAVVWTAVIPEGFPRYVYTWRLMPDGTYKEDGRQAQTGKPVQPTLSGHWTREGERRILRQDGMNFMFDGVIVGDQYTGALYGGGRRLSRFCAVRGETALPHCEIQISGIRPPSRPLAQAWASLPQPR